MDTPQTIAPHRNQTQPSTVTCDIKDDLLTTDTQVQGSWGVIEYFDEILRFKLGACDCKKFSFEPESYLKPKELLKKIYDQSFSCKITFGPAEIKDGRFTQSVYVPDSDVGGKSKLRIASLELFPNSQLVKFAYLFILRQAGEEFYQELIKNVSEASLLLPELVSESERSNHSVLDIIKNGEIKIKFKSPSKIFQGSNPSGRVGSFRNVLISHKDRISTMILEKADSTISQVQTVPVSTKPKSPIISKPVSPAMKLPTPSSKISKVAAKPEKSGCAKQPQLQSPSKLAARPLVYTLQDLLSDLRLLPSGPGGPTSKAWEDSHIQAATSSTKDRSSDSPNQSFSAFTGAGWEIPYRTRTIDVGTFLVRMSKQVAGSKVKDVLEGLLASQQSPELLPILSRCGKILLAVCGIDLVVPKASEKQPVALKSVAACPMPEQAVPFQLANPEEPSCSIEFKSIAENIPVIGNSSWAISEAKEEMRTHLQQQLRNYHQKYFARERSHTTHQRCMVRRSKQPQMVSLVEEESQNDSCVIEAPPANCRLFKATSGRRASPKLLTLDSDPESEVLQQPTNILANLDAKPEVEGSKSILELLNRGKGKRRPNFELDFLESEAEGAYLFHQPKARDLLMPEVSLTYRAEKVKSGESEKAEKGGTNSWRGVITVSGNSALSKLVGSKGGASGKGVNQSVTVWGSSQQELMAELGIALGILLFKDYSTITVEQLWDRCTELVIQLPPDLQRLVNAKDSEPRSSPVPTQPNTHRGGLLGKRQWTN